MIATWARVSAARLTEGGALIGWAGGQPYLPLLLRRGVTVGDGEVASPFGRGVLRSKTERVAPSGEEVSSDTNVYLPTIPNKTL